jgi:hypothetical protein
MFILSYLRKKQTIKVKEDTLDHLDDDFIVISDSLNTTSIEENYRGDEDTKEQNVKNIDILDDVKIDINSIEENSDTSFSASFNKDEEKQLIENIKDNNYKKLSLCDKIMNTLRVVYQILNEKFRHSFASSERTLGLH